MVTENMSNKFCIATFLLFLLIPTTESMSHELNKNATLLAHVQQRKQYDACLKNAPNNTTQAKKCRKAYANSRRLTAKQLFHLYMEHPLEAEELYDDMLIGLSGRISALGNSPLGMPEAVLALDELGLSGVRVEFSPQSMEKFKQLQLGDTLYVVAICKGVLQENFVRVVNAEF